ncbi:hypothetical protein RF11_09038 [Thelohanellus kitauei]|uniref:Uncharacterized protein n=1 Tax=Thelohanellus kitauei TaxID=669202 RepID=A0A0C2IYV7_THEKT|nr:hypothetical protein RF11_09038 [Thelohanellus kitauei]
MSIQRLILLCLWFTCWSTVRFVYNPNDSHPSWDIEIEMPTTIQGIGIEFLNCSSRDTVVVHIARSEASYKIDIIDGHLGPGRKFSEDRLSFDYLLRSLVIEPSKTKITLNRLASTNDYSDAILDPFTVHRVAVYSVRIEYYAQYYSIKFEENLGTFDFIGQNLSAKSNETEILKDWKSAYRRVIIGLTLPLSLILLIFLCVLGRLLLRRYRTIKGRYVISPLIRYFTNNLKDEKQAQPVIEYLILHTI